MRNTSQGDSHAPTSNHIIPTARTKTTRYFTGVQALACTYEQAETYMDGAGDDDLEEALDYTQDAETDFYDEVDWQAEVMARHNLTTQDQYEHWLDDAIEDFEERRYQRLLLDAERD